MMSIEEKIVSTAKSFIGQTEKPNNSGFKNALFQVKQVLAGWLYGQPWCAYTAEIIWFDAFTGDTKTQALIRKYCSGSAVQTLSNFAKSKEFHVQLFPSLGAIVIFKHGNGPQGHAGVVTEIIDSNIFVFISGNTSVAGSREGTTVLPKSETLNKPFSAKGLNIAGFVNPVRIA